MAKNQNLNTGNVTDSPVVTNPVVPFDTNNIVVNQNTGATQTAEGTNLGTSTVTTGEGGNNINVQPTTNQISPDTNITPKDTQDALKQQQGNIAQQQQNLQSDIQQQQTDLSKQYTSDKMTEVAFANTQEQLIKETGAAIGEVQDERAKQISERQVRDVGLLQEEQSTVQSRQQAEIDLALQEKELQKIKDDNAIKEAEYKNELELQKAAWSFNKLGLGFSSGIILETQAIATRGANQIVQLKVQASYNQAKIGVEVAKLMEEINKTQLDYTREINNTIDKYQNLELQNESDIIDRINEVENNLLLNNKEKKDAISALKKEYIDNKNSLSNELKTETERLADKQIDIANQLELQQEKSINTGKQNINDALNNGSLFNKTVLEKQKLAESAGLTLSDIVSLENTILSSEITKKVATVMGDSFLLTGTERTGIYNEAKNIMATGKNLEESISLASAKILGNNELYKASKKAELYRVTSVYSQATGTNVKGSDMIRNVEPDGTISFTNRLTGETITATRSGTYIIQSPGPVVAPIQVTEPTPVKAYIKESNNTNNTEDNPEGIIFP